MSQEEKQKKLEKIHKMNSEIFEEKLSLLEKLLIIAGCLQIINEGIDELKGLSVFKQDFKRKMNNFSNFVERSSDDLRLNLTIKTPLKLNFTLFDIESTHITSSVYQRAI